MGSFISLDYRDHTKSSVGITRFLGRIRSTDHEQEGQVSIREFLPHSGLQFGYKDMGTVTEQTI
jgi:hypothetical protein